MKAGAVISDSRADNQKPQSEGSASPEPDFDTLPDLPGITLTPAQLSRGPIAAVYRGWDRIHNRDVIVKVQRAAGDPVAAERFRREAAVMARLRHPHIVAVYEFYDGDPAALVLEYVSGRTLANLVNTEGRLNVNRAVQVVEEIAAALDSAHAQGIIHRDVKPSNILLPKRGPAKLTDFGVAHIDEEAPLTMMGDILGTIEYASPEQVHGNQVPDSRSDVYSLAAVAYFALTGVPPFQAADSTTQAQLSVMHRQVFSEPISLRAHRADLSPSLDAAILRGLAKSPEARYPSAGQFAATLRVALGTAGLGAAASDTRVMAFTSRRSGLLVGGVASLLLLGVILLWKTRPPVAPSGHPPVHVAKVEPISPPKPLPSETAHALPKPLPSVPRLTPKAAAIVKAVPKAMAFVKPTPSKPTPKPIVSAETPRRYVKTANAIPKRPSQLAVKPYLALGHPRARQHSLLTATVRTGRAKAHSRPAAAPAKSTTGRAWLYVYANQNIAPLSPTAHMVNIRPRSVYVDGRPDPDLTAGRWASLPAGSHVISFNTDARTGFSSRSGVRVHLAPGSRVGKQILLPVISNAGARLGVPLPAPINPEKLTAAPEATHIAYTVGWYTVSGWIAADASGQKSGLKQAAPAWVKVDGKPVPALAQGQWAELPAGKHTIIFQPVSNEVGPKTWDIDLASQAHLDQKVPLSAALTANASAPPVGWYTVSGWVAANTPGQQSALTQAAPAWVKVDGKPVPALAQGQWAELPAGKHTVIFQPAPGVEAGPKTWDIDLAPQAHLDQKVPLPSVLTAAAPAVGWYTVSGWIAANKPGEKPNLVRATPDWVMVDGDAVPALAQGHWAQLPAGKHTITFQPVAGLGAGLKIWDIELAPQAHLDQKVPLPADTTPFSAPTLSPP